MDLFNAIIDQHRNWLPHEGTVNYYGRLLSKESADFYLNRLLETIEWRNDEAIIFGRNGLPRVGRAGTDPIDDHAAFTELYDRYRASLVTRVRHAGRPGRCRGCGTGRVHFPLETVRGTRR